MSYGRGSSAASEYQSVGAYGAAYADPHRLIQMLMEGALMRIAAAKGALAAGDIARKANEITKGIAIIDGLLGSLDMEKGGELAENLEGLYEYVQRRLLEANAYNDPAGLEEAASLIGEVKGAWDAIGPELRSEGSEASQESQLGVNATG